VQTFGANNLNELSNVTRAGTLTVAGTATSVATNVTVADNGNAPVSVSLYADRTFARTNVTVLNGDNAFIAIAQDGYNRKDTNSVTVNLPATVNYIYDANGNLTSDGTRGFDYDDENQLTRITVTNSWKSEFTYDGRMRRRIRKEFTWSGSWAQTAEVRYIYDGMLVIQERDANNLPTVTYTRGRDLSGSLQGAGGIGGLLARTDAASGQSACYHSDGNGNVTAMNNAQQVIAAKYIYDPFGNILSKSGPLADANTYRFSSQEYHQNSGLVLYLYRAYDPNLQRFVNRDPIQERGGMNLFGFVGNSPIDYIDPFGLMTKAECQALRGQIFRKSADLLDDLRRYDPVEDGKGGFPKHGGGLTKLGGHFDEILQRKGGLRKDLTRYLKECIKCDDDEKPPGKPIPKWIDEMVSRPIPSPVYPSPNPIIYVPGSSGFWGGVGTGAGVIGIGAAVIGTGGAVGGLIGGGGGALVIAL